jgi:hypothetical protein
MQKHTGSQKHKNLTSEGKRFMSPFFLCLMQTLKAVTMGVVASIEFVWSNMANPAIAISPAAIARQKRLKL